LAGEDRSIGKETLHNATLSTTVPTRTTLGLRHVHSLTLQFIAGIFFCMQGRLKGGSNAAVAAGPGGGGRHFVATRISYH
jgi:hypothetical protein